jgi:Protein of unknown function (DUF2934)
MRSPPNFDPLRFARPNRLSDDVRHSLIAEAAYFRAQRRGPGTGNAVDDWLAAEQEVNARLRTQPLRNG